MGGSGILKAEVSVRRDEKSNDWQWKCHPLAPYSGSDSEYKIFRPLIARSEPRLEWPGDRNV